MKKVSHLVTPNTQETKKKKKKTKKQLKIYPFITDFAEWKKKQRLDPETKIFIILGGYPDLKQSLLERGWLENPDSSSFCFDIKWTLFAKDISYEKLQVLHFEFKFNIFWFFRIFKL